ARTGPGRDPDRHHPAHARRRRRPHRRSRGRGGVSVTPMNGHAIAYWIVGKGLIGSLVRLFVDFRSYGTERVPRGGGAVLAMSHLSYLDPPVYGTSCPRRIVFMA